ncbi:MAG: tetratricopeptide repeat protein [Gammaproteobacteria bacterium]
MSGKAKAARRKGARSRPAKRLDLLQRAVRSHDGGRLADAERAYRRFLELNPDHPLALHNLGLLLNQSGRTDEAIARLERAAALAPDDASVHSNLGNMLQESGDLDGAEHAYRAALAADPAHANASYNLASVLQDRGKMTEAIERYRVLLDRLPRDAGAWNNLGSALLANAQPGEAVQALERALELQPRYPRALLNLGMARLGLEDSEGAERFFREALALDPELAEAHQNLGGLLNALERLDEAHHSLRRALELRPDNAKGLRLFGRICKQLDESDRAIEAFRRYLELEPGDVQIWCELGSALSARGRIAEAVEAIGHAQTLEPDSPRVVYATGLAQLIQGDTEAARATLHRAGELMPDSPEVWFNVAKTRRFGAEDEDTIARVASIAERRTLAPMSEAHLHFTLAKMHDDRDRPEQAFEHYRKGNEIMRARSRFDPREIPDKVERSIATYTPALFARLAGLGSASELPVFIFGMPRSGTTLVEQILASHPSVHGAGELTRFPELAVRSAALVGGDLEYPESMQALGEDVASALCEDYLALLRSFSADALRVTDKLPGNYLYLGAIALLFPKAKLIHCRRSPMDICVSNYTQLFADGMPFSYSLKDLGDTYRAYERMMAHWRAVLAGPAVSIYEVDYETLTAEQERVSRELIAFCGLEWDDRCLHFYDNDRAVNTASNWQVRQPIYRSAVARWKRYEPWLGELEQALSMEGEGGSVGGLRP